MHLKKYKPSIIITLIITVLTAILLLIPNQDNIIFQTIKLIFSSVFVLFIPGYFLTLNFFDEKEIDYLQRIALSFALSISIIPLLSFYLNLIGVNISSLSVFLIVIGIILTNIFYLKYRKIGKKI